MSDKNKNIATIKLKERHKCSHENKKYQRYGQYAQVVIWTCKRCRYSGEEPLKICVIL